MRLVAAAALLAALLVVGSSAVYLRLEEGVQRCFLEDVPRETLIQGTFRGTLDPPGEPSQSIGIVVVAQSPDNKEIMSKPLGLSGRFAFTSREGGEHQVCFKTNTTRWYGGDKTVLLSFELKSGADAIDYKELAKLDHLNSLEIKLRQLSDRVYQIRAEQSYQKGREEEFRSTSELTNSRVAYWSIGQILVLVAAGFYQSLHLRHFFRGKKLV